MSLGDLGNGIFILFIFTLLHLLMSLSIGISNIKNNWDKYKCNPGIMPFAPVFGHDTLDNFNECVKVTQVGFMQTFLAPIYQSLYYFAQNGAKFTEIFEDLKVFGNIQDSAMGDFTSTVKTRLYSIVHEINKVYINIVDTFSKLGSTITVLFYTIQSGILIAGAAWENLPGTLMRLAGGG